MNHDFACTSAIELPRRYRAREVSPAEAVTQLIARIDVINPRINAFVHRSSEEALVRARAVEKIFPAGAAAGPVLQ